MPAAGGVHQPASTAAAAIDVTVYQLPTSAAAAVYQPGLTTSAKVTAYHQPRSTPAAVAADVAPRQLPTIGVDAAAYQPPTSVVAASQYAAMQANVAVRTTARTLTAQSLSLLDLHTPQISPHSSIFHWLQTSESMPQSTQAESLHSIDHSELQQALPLGADAAMPRTSRMSRTVSHSTRHTRHSATSSLPLELFNF